MDLLIQILSRFGFESLHGNVKNYYFSLIGLLRTFGDTGEEQTAQFDPGETLRYIDQKWQCLSKIYPEFALKENM